MQRRRHKRYFVDISKAFDCSMYFTTISLHAILDDFPCNEPDSLSEITLHLYDSKLL